MSLFTQRRRCRSTQTRFYGTGSDSDEDGPGHSPWKLPRGPQARGLGGSGGGARGPHPFPSTLMRTPRSALGRSPNTSRSNLRLRRRHNDSQDLKAFKKSFAGANATLESESEESGYGDTLGEYTMHASSFDTHLDEPSMWMGSEHTPLTYIESESDNESTASYISGIFLPVDPKLQREKGTQTPGHAKTQTVELQETHNTITTQTEELPQSVAVQTLDTSFHSIGAQTKRKSRSRANMLRSLLSEVKDIKKQHGLDDSRDDISSIASDATTINREILETLTRDVAALKAASNQSSVANQTSTEHATQTIRFSEEEALQQSKMDEMLEDIRQLKAAHLSSEFDQRARPFYRATTPVRFEAPHSVTNHVPPQGEPMANGHMYAVPQEMMAGRRRVTQEELNNISERLEKLNNYQIPRRHNPYVSPFATEVVTVPPPPPPAQPVIVQPTRALSPRRYRVREFTRSYDDIDMLSDDDYRSRRRRSHRGQGGVMERYHLDDAILEATRASKKLKIMSAKMKRNLHDELNRSRY